MTDYEYCVMCGPGNILPEHTYVDSDGLRRCKNCNRFIDRVTTHSGDLYGLEVSNQEMDEIFEQGGS